MPLTMGTRTRIALRNLYISFIVSLYDARSNLHNIVYCDKMLMTRFILSLSSLTWAWLLLGDSVLFTDKRTTYLVMRAIFSEETWGTIFMVSGLTSLFSVLFGVKNKVTLIFDAFLGGAVWTASTLACFAAHWPHEITTGWLDQLHAWAAPAAMSGEFWLSVAAWWHFIRHVTDRVDTTNNICLKREDDDEPARCR